jgi:signal transduction histidine kinase
VSAASKPSVLVVDDTIENLALMHGLLKTDYRTLVASNGQLALDIAGTVPQPDLVLLDIMMPEIDGYEVCRRLKDDPATAHIPVIFLTARTEIEDEQRGFALGAVDYIAKPISPPVVLARVKTHLTLKAAADFMRDRNLFLEEEVRRRTAQLLDQQQQLHQAQKMEAVGQLAGGIAHDFNNLLTIVIGNLDLLEGQLESESAIECVGNALKASLRGEQLTRQLLALSRRQKLQSQVIDLNQLVQGIASLLGRTLGPNIEIKPLLDETLWRAEADPGHLESALVNLALNARDAMPSGGQLTIETANTVLDAQYAADNAKVTPGDYVMLAVTDTGTGIPADILDRVFDPFFTTKGVGKGTGLGLSMVYGFAQQSGGHVKIESKEGHGTVVRLYLPKAKREARSVAASAQSAAAPAGKGEVVLIVEDNDDVRNVVRQQLTEQGYRLLLATNPTEAIGIVEGSDEIDLVFTDMVMPGKLTCRDLVLKTKEVRPGLPILLTSGYSEVAVETGAMLDGADGILRKPYRRQDLARKIRELLDRA